MPITRALQSRRVVPVHSRERDGNRKPSALFTESGSFRLLPIGSCGRPARGQVIRGWGAIVIGDRAYLRVLRKVTLTKVFFEWMTRLERCIEINGDYVG
jgi:hypothetical protein